jgi:ABC-type multidrug transport system fused ATPase/permease subunit
VIFRRRLGANLLASTLRPEARAFSGVLLVLLVGLGIRLCLPVLLAIFVDDAIDGATAASLSRLAGLYVAGALLAEAIRLWVTWHSVRLSWRSGNRLRERLADHAVRLDMAWHGRFSPGQLIERIDGDVEAMVVFFTNALVHVVGNIVLTVGLVAVAFAIDPRAGLVLAATTLVGGTALFRLRAAAVPAREAEREANAILYGDLEERLGGLEDLRANGAGNYAVHRLHTNSARTWRAARRASLIGDGSYSVASIVFAVGSVATIALGFILANQQAVTVGQVLALYRFSEILRQPLELIAEQLKEFQKALAGAHRASAMLATTSSITPGSTDLPHHGGAGVEVSFRNTTLRYDDTNVAAVDDVSLTVPAGSHIGLVGRTGSGKTTLGRMVARLWDPTEGQVLINGVDVRDLTTESLRSTVAVVTQDVEVLTATVRENLTLFDRERNIGDATIIDVLNRVGLNDWFSHQPDGLDTVLEGAGALSAGEAQLLVLARVFLRDPAVVVLDEASSRLDADSEQRMSRALRELLDGRTALLIAHRLATLDNVDRIAVMHGGRLVEHGERKALANTATSHFASLLRAGDADLVVPDTTAEHGAP